MQYFDSIFALFGCILSSLAWMAWSDSEKMVCLAPWVGDLDVWVMLPVEFLGVIAGLSDEFSDSNF